MVNWVSLVIYKVLFLESLKVKFENGFLDQLPSHSILSRKGMKYFNRLLLLKHLALKARSAFLVLLRGSSLAFVSFGTLVSSYRH